VLKNCRVEPLPYYTVKCYTWNLKSAMKRVRAKYPDSRVAFSTNYIPDGVNLTKQLKAISDSKFHYNHFDVPWSEERICLMLEEMCNDDYLTVM
jgi:Protein of unknown function (DUF3627)